MQVRKRPHIELLEHTMVVDIVSQGNVCYGAVIRKADGSLEKVEADYTVFATGGIGGLYRHSTNFRHVTGDALAIACRHNVALKDINYVQIHPTTLYSPEDGGPEFSHFGVGAGEGAKLYDKT